MPEGSDNPKLWAKVTIAVAVIGFLGTIVGALIGILPNIVKPQTPGAATPTEAMAAPSPTAGQEIAPPTLTSPSPTAPEPPTQHPPTASEPAIAAPPTKPPPLAGELQVYDPFEGECLRKQAWGMFVDSLATPMFLPTPPDECWELAQGFSSGGGRLTFDGAAAAERARSFSLVQATEQTVSAAALDLTVQATHGRWGGVGLFTRLNDADRSWVYYFLQFGGDLPIGRGRVIYEDASGQQTQGEALFSLPLTTTLELRWDGQAMHFYADGQPALPPVPFAGFSDTFGIYWLIGPDSALQCHADEFRLAWK
jgi:hypothetical protein